MIWSRPLRCLGPALALTAIVQGGAAHAQRKADAPDAAGGVAAPATPAAPARLEINEFDVDGNTVLDEVTIDDALAPFLGPGKGPDDVDAARAALEQVYRARGFKTVSVAIPRQSVRDGIILLQVSEVRVEHLNVIGAEYHSIDDIKNQAPSLWEGGVPDFNQVQKDLVALNQQADRRVTPALKAGGAPGTVDVDLVVDDHLPLHGSVELNNRRSQDTSEMRLVGSVSYDNLWQRGHSLSISYQTAPQNQSDARVLFGSYLWRFHDSNFSLLFNALKSDSNVATVGGTNVLGSGRLFGMRGVWQLDGWEGFYPTASLGVTYKRFHTLTALGSDSFTTPVEYLPFTADLSGVYAKTGVTGQFDLSLNLAVPEWGSTKDTLGLSRTRARGQMFWLRGSHSITEELLYGTQFMARLSAQYTDQPLISNEQFSVGGADTVRGYLESEALGDYGYASTLELRSPSFGNWISFGTAPPAVEEARGFVFVDGATARLHQADPQQHAHFSPYSYGGGFNFKLLTHFNAELVWAHTGRSEAATPADTNRYLFRLWSSY